MFFVLFKEMDRRGHLLKFKAWGPWEKWDSFGIGTLKNSQVD